MTILEIIQKITGQIVPNLLNFLDRVETAVPDLQSEAEHLKNLLSSSVQIDAQLAATLIAELEQIAKGKVDPRRHPSDAI